MMYGARCSKWLILSEFLNDRKAAFTEQGIFRIFTHMDGVVPTAISFGTLRERTSLPPQWINPVLQVR